MQSQRNETGPPESVAIPPWPPRGGPPEVSRCFIGAGEDFEVRHAAGEPVQLAQSATQLVVSHVVQHAQTQDQVEGPIEPARSDRSECAEAEVAPRSESPHRVGAAIDTHVFRPGPQRTEHRGPVALAATDIEDAPDGSIEQVLRDANDEAELPLHVGSGLHPVARVSVPLVEVTAIVMREVAVHAHAFHQQYGYGRRATD